MKVFMFSYLCIALIICPESFAQLGIKTYQPQPIQSENLVRNGTTPGSLQLMPVMYTWNGTHFKNEFDLFLNKTKSSIAPGVCFKEVPTASLVGRAELVPAGNGSNPSMSRIQVCCEGYEQNIHNYKTCDPVCKNGCINGLCTAPEVCTCFPDHVRNLAGFCIPTCPIGCQNGECQGKNCICKSGYVLEPNRKFCVPTCTQSCTNGNCTSPGVCECLQGYENTPDGRCSPKCVSCENGDCIAPGVCKCKLGYVLKNNRCEPICLKECINGFCIAPNTCSCKPGFILDPTGTKCTAHCDKPCLNGYCSGSNTCACNPGYTLAEYSPNLCVPQCQGGCLNGYCTAPNMCLCKPGFVKSGVKGNQKCVPV